MKRKTKTVNKVDSKKKAKKEASVPYRGNDFDYVSDKYHDDSSDHDDNDYLDDSYSNVDFDGDYGDY